MTPAHLPLALTRGGAWAKSFQLMTPDWQYRPVTAISRAAPLRLTVPAHGLPAGQWPVWLQGTTSSALNRDKDRQPPWVAAVVDADTLEINVLDGTRINAAGGMLAFHAPVDLTGCVPVLRIGTLELTVGSGLQVGQGGIQARLTAEQVAALQPCGWELVITMADGQPIKWLCGEVTINDCKTC